MKPKTIGILGGAGPLAGAALLDRVLRLSQVMYGCNKDADFPKVILISFPFSEMLTGDIDIENVRKELKDSLRELRQNGAAVLGIACNTLHAFLDEDEQYDDLILLPQAVAGKVDRDVPLVLCTSTSVRFNLHKRFFPCNYLDPERQRQLDEVIEWILAGKEETAVVQRLIEIINGVQTRTIVLGCTEISLFKDPLALLGIRVIDPLDILAEAILKKSYQK